MAEHEVRQVLIDTICEALDAATMAQLGVLLKLVRGYLGA